MRDDDDWLPLADKNEDESVSQTGAVKIAIFFTMGVLALTAFLAPYATDRASQVAFSQPDIYDQITTGSIEQAPERSSVYTLQRRILQNEPGSLCVINPDGSRYGDC